MRIRWGYWFLSMACVVTGIWLTQTEPWWYATPLLFSAFCLGLLAFMREE